VKSTRGKKSKRAVQDWLGSVPNKSPRLFVTTQVSPTQPSGETFVAKPEIRHAGIVDVEFGKDVTVVQPVNLYGCAIGDGSFVGPFVEIQKSVNIGKRCRIQSHSFICELVTIGDECFISHGAMFVNDLFGTGGPAENPELWRPTKLGNRVSVGTNATILPVTICDQVVIGAGSVVTKDITVPGIYAGNPARLLRRL
jgi:acetyltransferase-like isoleucine patch superfamily enzyme